MVLPLLPVLLASGMFAQSRKKIKDSTTVIVFNQSNYNETSRKKATGETNILKIAPFGFASGTFPVLYERRIADFFSIQASGGLTFRNYARQIIQGERGDDFTLTDASGAVNDKFDEAEQIYHFDYRQPKMGYMFGLQPRFYFESDALDGSFMGLAINRYRYNFQVPGMTPDGRGNYTQTGPLQQEHENIMDYMVCWGIQHVYDRLTLEYTSEVGIRNVKGVKYAAYDMGSGAIQDQMANYKQTLLNVNIGIKVGYHF